MRIIEFIIWCATNVIIWLSGGYLTIKLTYTDVAEHIFTVPVFTEMLWPIQGNVIGLWGIMGVLLGIWSWFLLSKYQKQLSRKYGNLQLIPDYAIHYANSRHFRNVLGLGMIIGAALGIIVGFLLDNPEGFTKINEFLIIGEYSLAGFICSAIAHSILMKLGQIIGI